MPLTVKEDNVFCLDFRRETGGYVPYEATIPSLVYRKGATTDRIAFNFDSENVSLKFEGVRVEMEKFAAGLLNTQLEPGDRILLCGNNHSQLIVATLGAARAGLIFSLASPNFSSAAQLRHLLSAGEFRALLMFGPSDKANQMLLEIGPEMQKCQRGRIKMNALQKLTHVIYADEDHKHAGAYTLSDIFLKSNKELVAKLPNYQEWGCHQLGAIQFTAGSTGPPKAVGLSHYQLINGSRIAAQAIGIKKETILCCALPLFRVPVFALVVFTPFLLESRAVFSEPSPLPRLLFQSINKHQCTNLLSNAAALRLLLKTCSLVQGQKVTVPSVDTVILLGERVSTELLTSIEKVAPKAKNIAVGMLCTELGSVPILSDNTTNLVKAIGKPLNGYEADVAQIDKMPSNGRRVGELRLRPLAKTKFIGYGPTFDANADWVNTGDVACITEDGNIEIVTPHKEDLVFDKIGRVVEHWKMERMMAHSELLRGVQVIQLNAGGPVIAVCMPKDPKSTSVAEVRTEMVDICRENKLNPPDQICIVADFPRVNARIQKFKLRQMLKEHKLAVH